jgi:hypothetical protein
VVSGEQSETGWIEVWGSSGPELRALANDDLCVGKDDTNDVVLANDSTVSRLHCVLERVGSRWSIRDLGSRNGTQVNGKRIAGDQVLKPGDEIRLGRTRLVFRGPGTDHRTGTDAVESCPNLTPRERDVLIELCRPLVGGDVFTEPASIRRMADALVVSEDAIKKHLVRLYDKFGIVDGHERRRVQLANEALSRGAVNLLELKGP